MRKGTLIYCHDQEDMTAVLKELSDAGYGVEIFNPDIFTVVITREPKEERE